MAVEMFIKVEGILGDSQDKSFRDTIVVQAWNWGASNPISAISSGTGGTGMAKPAIQDFTFFKAVDKATPTLYLYMLQGKRIKTCILTCRKAGAKDKFLEIRMSECILNGVETGCEVGEENITETVGIQFARVDIEYTGTDASGKKFTMRSGWDAVKNTSI